MFRIKGLANLHNLMENKSLLLQINREEQEDSFPIINRHKRRSIIAVSKNKKRF
jgi:hypothetical protein